jgi:hypothetical protein
MQTLVIGQLSEKDAGPLAHVIAGSPASGFNERLLETVLGVGIAYLFGLGLPSLAQQRRRRNDSSN